MADFIKRPSIKSTGPSGGILSYSKDRSTDTICTSCKKNPLTQAQLDFCKRKKIPELCYNCQRSEGHIK